MDLDIKRVLAARPGEPEDVTLAPLTTVWGDALDTNHVLDAYPRPQMRRQNWTCLNGLWEYAIVESSEAANVWRVARPPQAWDGAICVPFSPEASLSGVGRQLLPSQLLWYGRCVTLDAVDASRSVLLNFEAVDYACACYVNDERVGEHVGGYLPFSFDVTSAVHAGENRIELCVYDPSDTGTQLRGKQRLHRANMWYTAQSGIWQTVWLEEVPKRYVADVRLRADADEGTLAVEAQVSELGDVVAVDLFDATGVLVASADAPATEGTTALSMHVDEPRLWSPDDPYLYSVRVAYGTDEVMSYCAFRTVGVEADEAGVPRFCLNHKPFFMRGLLDQGYWPDSLMTAPADDALVFDIVAARSAGFNLLRKHIKIESRRWYWHCDRLGMLVCQDMVSGGDMPGEWVSVNIPTLVRRSWTTLRDTKSRNWKRMGAGDKAYRTEWIQTAREAVRMLSSHPCICSWVVFNESWGQFSSAEMCETLRAVDDSRPYVATSGWYDQGAGDFYAVHNYFRSMRVYKDAHKRPWQDRTRAFVIDEFGGLTYSVEGHCSVPTNYGYDSYDNLDEWKAAYNELLATMDELEKDGLSGYVYTQVSDVEEETNGLLTYDRRVNKL
ncbi:MAG: glycoside hydrolase family 2 TIM barrel-domain containing protein [Coriobacteriales bacterium]|nr:glycoside hydrolase family 2 TIM barrel-domain containing protein [Coriobacteriales bacterium]